MTHSRRLVQVLIACLVLVSGLFGALPAREAAAANEQWCPKETGVCTANAFLDFWRAQPNALETLGYPIDQPRQAPNGLVIQFFERAIMEWHPENGIEYQVLLTRLGAALIDGNPRTQQPPVPCDANCALLQQTNHTLRGSFLGYWTTYGGLPVYGFPLTEEYGERNAADGKTYTVQYFERNRFEYHPEHAGTRYEVLLGRLGAEVFAARAAEIRGWPVAGIPNYGDRTPPPPPPASVSISPSTGFPGSTFTLRVANLPPGAIVTSEWINDTGLKIGAKTFTLNPTETTLSVTVGTTGIAPGTHTIVLRIGSAVVGKVTFAIVNSESDQQLVLRAVQLINAIPDARYLVDNQIQNKVKWMFRDLPKGTAGYYESTQNVIAYGAFLRPFDSHDLAALMGHEGQHAYDHFKYGPTQRGKDCYTREYRAFIVEAALWKIWYGPKGKPNPANDFERFENALLYLLQTNPAKFEAWLIETYAEECGALQTFAHDAAPGGGVPASLEGLPASVAAELPDAGRLLGDFDPDRVAAYEHDPNLPPFFKH